MCHYSCSICKMRHYHYHLKHIYINGKLNRQMHTRQHDLIQREIPRTKFSAKQPRHNFTNIWNGISSTIRKATHRQTFKSLLRQHYLDHYKTNVNCINPRCIDAVHDTNTKYTLFRKYIHTHTDIHLDPSEFLR